MLSALLENSAYARPGAWLILEPRIARHITARHMPGSLVASKSLKRLGIDSLKAILRRILYLAVPPFLARIRRNPVDRPIDARATFLVLSKFGDVVLLSPDDGEVIRINSRASGDEESAEARRRLGRYFLLPDTQPITGARATRERFVGGRPFTILATQERLAVVEKLITQYRKLSAEQGRDAPDGYWQEMGATAAARSLIPDAGGCGQALAEQLGPLKFTPAHGDLSGANIIVDDAGPWLIDVEESAWLPAWFDIFFLSHQELLAGRADLWQHFLAGSGWCDLEAGLAGSGLFPGAAGRSAWLVGAFLVECFLLGRKHDAEAGKPDFRRAWLPVEALTIMQRDPGSASGAPALTDLPAGS